MKSNINKKMSIKRIISMILVVVMVMTYVPFSNLIPVFAYYKDGSDWTDGSNLYSDDNKEYHSNTDVYIGLSGGKSGGDMMYGYQRDRGAEYGYDEAYHTNPNKYFGMGIGETVLDREGRWHSKREWPCPEIGNSYDTWFHVQFDCIGASNYIAIPNPSRDNYDFAGWEVIAQSGASRYEMGSYRGYTMFWFDCNTAGIQLAAKWKPKQYSIDVNEYVWNQSTQNYEQHTGNFLYARVNLKVNGETLSSNATDAYAVRDYNSSYEVTASSATMAYKVDHIDNASGNLGGNTEVKVYMKPNQYTIRYYNKNSNNSNYLYKSEIQTYGQDVSVYNTKPSLAGYTFTGWQYKDGTYFGGGLSSDVESHIDNGYIDVYAQYSTNKYIINLVQDDATKKGTETVTVDYKGSLSDIDIPEQKYKARFFENTKFNKIIANDIIQSNDFRGYVYFWDKDGDYEYDEDYEGDIYYLKDSTGKKIIGEYSNIVDTSDFQYSVTASSINTNLSNPGSGYINQEYTDDDFLVFDVTLEGQGQDETIEMKDVNNFSGLLKITWDPKTVDANGTLSCYYCYKNNYGKYVYESKDIHKFTSGNISSGYEIINIDKEIISFYLTFNFDSNYDGNWDFISKICIGSISGDSIKDDTWFYNEKGKAIIEKYPIARSINLQADFNDSYIVLPTEEELKTQGYTKKGYTLKKWYAIEKETTECYSADYGDGAYEEWEDFSSNYYDEYENATEDDCIKAYFESIFGDDVSIEYNWGSDIGSELKIYYTKYYGFYSSPGEEVTINGNTKFIPIWEENEYPITVNIYKQNDGAIVGNKKDYTLLQSKDISSVFYTKETVINLQKLFSNGTLTKIPTGFIFGEADYNDDSDNITEIGKDITIKGDCDNHVINVYLNHQPVKVTVKYMIENIYDSNETLYRTLEEYIPLTSIYSAPKIENLENIKERDYAGLNLVNKNEVTDIKITGEMTITCHYKRKQYSINLYNEKPNYATTNIERVNNSDTFISNYGTKYTYNSSKNCYTTSFKYGAVIEIPKMNLVYQLLGYSPLYWADENGISVNSQIMDAYDPSGYSAVIKDGQSEINLWSKFIPNSYTLVYDKGLTDDNSSWIEDDTKNVTEASFDEYALSGTTHTFKSDESYDEDLWLKGRSYNINLDMNIPDTASTKKSLSIKTSSTDFSKIDETHYKLSGHLSFDGWSLTTDRLKKDSVGNFIDSDTQWIDYVKDSNLTYLPGYITAIAQYNSETIQLNKSYVPSMNGYIFDGWYTKAVGGKKVTERTIEADTSAYNETVYAHWIPISYDINYNKGKTDVDFSIDSSSHQFDKVSKLSTIKDLNKKGRSYNITFDVNKGLGSTQIIKSNNYSDNISGNLEFNYWTITDKQNKVIKNNLQNAAEILNLSSTNKDELTATANWKNKTIDNFPSVSRNGYTFNGWVDLNNNIVKSITINPDTTAFKENLKASWTPNKYTITFDKNTPGNATSSVILSENNRKVTFDSSIGVLPNPSLFGWSFEGWYTSKTGGIKVEDNSNYITDSDITVYAHWTQKPYVISFTGGNTNIVKSNKTLSCLYDANVTFIKNEGYFIGRSYTISFDTHTDNGSSLSPDVQSIKGNLEFSGKWNINGNEYNEEQTYTKPNFAKNGNTFNANITAKAVWNDKKINLPNPDERIGYKFKGWFTNTNWSTKIDTVNIKADTVSYNSIVYAKWEANTYNAVFDNNIPDIALTRVTTKNISPISIKYDETYMMSKNNQSLENCLEGWTFLGWSRNKDATSPEYNFDMNSKTKLYNLSATDNDTVILYAIWRDNDPISAETHSINAEEITDKKSVKISATDTGSGIAAYYFGKESKPSDDLFVSIPSKDIKAVFETSLTDAVTSEGTYYLYVKDRSNKIKYVSTYYYKIAFEPNSDNILSKEGTLITNNKFTSSPIKKTIISINETGTILNNLDKINSRSGVKCLGVDKNAKGTSAETSIRVNNSLSDNGFIKLHCIWQDVTAPIIVFNNCTQNNDIKQTVTFSLYDTDESGKIIKETGSDIYGYIIGKNQNPESKENTRIEVDNTSNFNKDEGYAENISVEIDTSGTYYIFAIDKAGNISNSILDGNGLKFSKIDYNPNGNTDSPASINITNKYGIFLNGTVIDELPTAIRTGYHDSVLGQYSKDNSKNWYEIKNDGNKTNPSESYTVNGNSIVYASWEANRFILSYNYTKNDNASSPMTNTNISQVEVVYDSQIPELNNPQMAGWNFIGWYENINNDITFIDIMKELNKSLVNNQGKLVYRYNNDCDVYSKWSEKDYKIIYNLNKPQNASNNPTGISEKKVKFDNNINYYEDITSDNPSLTGWTFIGWNTKADGTGIFIKNDIKYDWILSNATDITVYAQWKANTYTVRINADKPKTSTEALNSKKLSGWIYDNIGSFYKKTFIYDSEETIPDVNDTFSIKGWTPLNINLNGVETIGKNKWNFTSKQDDIINLSVSWKENQYMLSIFANGGFPINSLKVTEYDDNGNLITKNVNTTIVDSPTGKVSSIITKYESLVTLPEENSKLAYSFDEFNTDENQSGTSYRKGVKVSKLIDTDNGIMNIYSFWKQKQIVTLNCSSSNGIGNISLTNSYAKFIDGKWVNSRNNSENIIQEWKVTKDSIEKVIDNNN